MSARPASVARRVRVLIDVELHDSKPLAVFHRDLLKYWRDHLARTAPGRPESTRTSLSLVSTSSAKLESVTCTVLDMSFSSE
jgi:hypothetical protein